MPNALEVLKKYWNYNSFRAPQAQIIEALLSKEHVFASLPTGAGKSLCFQVPTLLSEGVCIVISPLIALMQDQIAGLQQRGIKAVMLAASIKQNEIVTLFDNLMYGNYKFLYLSPERLQSSFIQEKLRQLNVSIVAIDEAHCISEWGHDFRPSYRKVNIITRMHPSASVIALTASATKKVAKDIIEHLELDGVKQFRTSLLRPEIRYTVMKTNAVLQSISDVLTQNNNAAIVYTTSRKATKSISEFLNNKGFQSSFYHGGLSPEEKEHAYKNWLTEVTPVMVATNAFGMGIDKDNVNTIIHANLPFSIENYMQESGRAGRNGSASSAYLFYNDAVIATFKSYFEKSIVSLAYLKDIYINLNQYYQIALGEKPLERLPFDLAEFCTTYTLSYSMAFNAIAILEKEGIIELSENLNKRSTVKFISNQEHVFKQTQHAKPTHELIKTLLRTYGGLFDQQTKIEEFIIARKLKLSKAAVAKLLEQLDHDGVLIYRPVLSNQSITFLVPREDKFTINNIASSVQQRQKVKQEKKEAVLEFVTNADQCRTGQLLKYFGESIPEDCGTCDVCRRKSHISVPLDVASIAEQILAALTKNEMGSRELVRALQIDKDAVLTTLQLLLDKNKISITSQNKFQLK